MTTDKEKTHSLIYLFCIALLMTGMLFSHFLMSISQIFIALNWLAEGRLREKWHSFIHNPAALLLTSVFILHLAGLLYSSDVSYGLHDLKVKIPLALMPLVFSTTPAVKRKTFNRLMLFFIVVVFTATLVSFYMKISGKAEDVRKTSLFISHIRFSLNICLAFFAILFFVFRSKMKISPKLALAFAGIWLLVFLVMLEAATGLAIILVVSVLLLLYIVLRNNKRTVKIVALSLLAIMPSVVVLYCVKVLKDYQTTKNVRIDELDKITPLGNVYIHDTAYFSVESGQYPGLFVCNEEIEEAWNKRSSLKIIKKDSSYPMHYFTLIRFLNSKGLRKDADGINKLSDNEIAAIEKGVANAEYMNLFSVKSRLYKIAFEYNEYKRTGNARNRSVMQRFELWKAGVSLVKKHFWFGVGTGDVKNEFGQQLVSMNSTLKDTGLRAHNQFLTFLIAFGVTGLIWFLLTLFFPLVYGKKHFHYFFVIFFIIAFISMFTEDTLETQAGVTFYSFFTSFFLFQYNDKE